MSTPPTPDALPQPHDYRSISIHPILQAINTTKTMKRLRKYDEVREKKGNIPSAFQLFLHFKMELIDTMKGEERRPPYEDGLSNISST